MATVIQVKDVPEDLHRRLKARAAGEGVSVSQLVLREVRKSMERPSIKEVLARIAAQPEPRLRRSPAEMIREDRESR